MDVTLATQVFTGLSLVANALGVRQLFVPSRPLAAEYIPISDDHVEAFYIRRNRRDRQRHINVFDQNGHRIYTIERKTQFSPLWSMIEQPSRREIATIRAGLVDRYFDFHNKPGLQHREMIPTLSMNYIYRKFYLTDGAEYEWVRDTKYLERVINPGGGVEERRERVAKARLMRQFRFDYELLVDSSKIDREAAIATAFITMITEWGLASTPGTRGPSLVPKNLDPERPKADIRNQSSVNPIEVENRVFLVMEKPDGSRAEPSEINREAYAPGIEEPIRRLQIEDNGTRNRRGNEAVLNEKTPKAVPVF